MQHVVQGNKYLWRLPVTEQQRVGEIAAKYSLSYPVVQTLLTRGFVDERAIEQFLFSSWDTDVAHPGLLKDADKAVSRLILAIERGEKILIAGDYDVDGITSSALMLRCLLPLGAKINFFLPNRLRDGYGLSVKTVQRAYDNGYRVIITVDNGITAFEPALLAKKLGIDLIITDHHKPHNHLPEAYAVIDPHQHDCAYPYKTFAGVGVGFKIMSLLYERLGKEIPAEVYELLLLGTVADVVPLTGENRFWVRHGLQFVQKSESLALKVLKTNARLQKPIISSMDIGFFLTPQINALGRLEDPRAGVKFLIGSDLSETEQIGKVLLELNEARKSIEKSVVTDVENQIAAGLIHPAQSKCVVAAADNWPAGVIGLVASRFVGAYGVPTILFHLTKDGIAKGSCRSIPEFNMFEALHELRDLLITFGGHPMAAGLSLKVENLDAFKKRLSDIIAQKLTPEDLTRKIYLDAELRLSETNHKLIGDMAHLEPFGCENNQPLFYVRGVSLVGEPTLLKEAHVKCMVFAEGVVKPVIFFNNPELYEILVNKGSDSFDIAVHVTQNHWNGKVNVELQGIDIA